MACGETFLCGALRALRGAELFFSGLATMIDAILPAILLAAAATLPLWLLTKNGNWRSLHINLRRSPATAICLALYTLFFGLLLLNYLGVTIFWR